MSVSVFSEIESDNEMMRDVYVQELIRLARSDPRILVLDADLMQSNATNRFLSELPNQAFNIGIQEANMVGIAAGLSATGKIPFVHSFACFCSRRALDQIYISIAYSKLSVKVVGTDPGITASYNGGTHMSLEDVGIMRSLPGITIIEPVDNVMMKDIVRQTAYTYGLFYLRVLRKNPDRIFREGSNFEIGKGITLKQGKDATIIASGIMVSEAISAADRLAAEGIDLRVVNMFTIKPIDKELIVTCAKETGAIVTAENHSIYNGLGSAVSEVLVEKFPVPMERIGVRDFFGEVGSTEYLKRRFGLTSDVIVRSVRKVVQRKRKDQKQA